MAEESHHTRCIQSSLSWRTDNESLLKTQQPSIRPDEELCSFWTFPQKSTGSWCYWQQCFMPFTGMLYFFALTLAKFKIFWFGFGGLFLFGLLGLVCLVWVGFFWEKCIKSTGAEDFCAFYLPGLSVFVCTETPDLHTEAWPLPWMYNHNSVRNLPSVPRPHNGQCLFWGLIDVRKGGRSKGIFWKFYKAKLIHTAQ